MKRIRSLLAAAVGVILIMGCAPAAPARESPSGQAPAAAVAPTTAAPAAAPAAPPAAPKPLTGVSVAEPAPGLTFLQFRVAKARGFDHANGIDIEFQSLAGTPAVQAMVSGGLDFTMSAGSVLNARLSGAPVTVLMISVDKSTYALYARPEIRSPQDLRGMTVAVGAIGDSQYKELGVALDKLGLSFDDVRVVGLPGATQLASIQSGAVDAIVLAPPLDIQLERIRTGHHRLLNLGDYVVGMNGGLGVATTLLQTKPDVVDAMVTASLMGFKYMLENREGTLPVIMEIAEVDVESAGHIYDTMIKAYSDGPGKSTPTTRAEIVRQAAQLLQVPPPAQPDDAFEFGPLDRAAATLQASGWRPSR